MSETTILLSEIVQNAAINISCYHLINNE